MGVTTLWLVISSGLDLVRQMTGKSVDFFTGIKTVATEITREYILAV